MIILLNLKKKSTKFNFLLYLIFPLFTFVALRPLGFDPDSEAYRKLVTDESCLLHGYEPLFCSIRFLAAHFVKSLNLAQHLLNISYVCIAYYFLSKFQKRNLVHFYYIFICFCFLPWITTQIRFGIAAILFVFASTRSKTNQHYLLLIFSFLSHYLIGVYIALSLFFKALLKNTKLSKRIFIFLIVLGLICNCLNLNELLASFIKHHLTLNIYLYDWNVSNTPLIAKIIDNLTNLIPGFRSNLSAKIYLILLYAFILKNWTIFYKNNNLFLIPMFALSVILNFFSEFNILFIRTFEIFTLLFWSWYHSKSHFYENGGLINKYIYIICGYIYPFLFFINDLINYSLIDVGVKF